MTKKEVVQALLERSKSKQLDWLLELGAELTIAARSAYPVGGALGD